jgi:Ca2+-binding EF-hand superfamily protein
MKTLLIPAALLATAALLPAQEPEVVVEYVTEEERQQAYFEICDHDGSGWISYREAKKSLKLVGRDEYAVYDTDSDGRVTRAEFGERYRAVVDRMGAFQQPEPGNAGSRALTRNPDQLVNAYDQDANRSLDDIELATLLDDYELEGLPATKIMEKLDRDHTGELDGTELTQLSRLLSAPVELADPMDALEQPESIDELFGEVIARELTVDAVEQPPRIPGPVPHFRRLDFDNDGVISRKDLERLQSPLQLKARPGVALATLDTDGDGVVTLEEFRASM